MRSFVIIIALNCLLISVYGQNFKSLHESLQTNDRFSNMLNLQHYQSTNPNHAIVYFLLAEINDQYMRETNPISMYDFLETNYYHINTYLGLVLLKLDDKQARQDRDYYGNIAIIGDQRKVGLEDIINEVNIRKEAAQEYFNHAKTVHNSYVLFAETYNACLFKFREILASFPNYKTLYMMTNNGLRKDIGMMVTNFETALLHFSTYQKACAELPHILKVNTYTLKPITTYRLEGLVESDFMLHVVDLWDFGSWASDFLRVLDTDIATIRNGLNIEHQALKHQVEKFKNENIYYDKPSFYKPEDKFQNLIAKYDHHSLANDYVDYQNKKIKFLQNTRLSINNVNDTSSFFLINKLRFYNSLAIQKQALNAQAEQLKGFIQFSEIEKYIDFFDLNFNGMDGFKRWCVVEQYDNDQIFNRNLENLNEFIAYEARKQHFDGTYLEFQKKKFPFGIPRPNDALTDTSIQIQHKLISRGNQAWLLGTETKTGHNSKNFMLKADSNIKVEWLVYPENAITKQYKINLMQKTNVLDNGDLMVAGILHKSVSDTAGKTDVYVARYSELGVEKQFKLIPQQHCVNYFMVDEISEEYLLITQQTGEENPLNKKEYISLYNFNDSLIWQHQIVLDGNLVDVLVFNTDFLFVYNYRSINTGNKVLKNKEDESSLATLFVKRNGEAIEINQYAMEDGLLVDHAYKLTNNVFNIIGKAGAGEADEELLYFLVDDQGRPLYSNSTKLKYHKYQLN